MAGLCCLPLFLKTRWIASVGIHCTVLHYCYYFCLTRSDALLFAPQNILSENNKVLITLEYVLWICTVYLFTCVLLSQYALSSSIEKAVVSSWRIIPEQKSLAFYKKVLCIFSTRIIFDFRQCKIKIAVRACAAFHAPLCIAAWKNKEQRDGDAQEILASLPLKTSTITQQRHLAVTTDTLEINYLWNAVKNSLIFSFTPIKMPNPFKPFTKLMSNIFSFFFPLLLFLFSLFVLRLHIRKNGRFSAMVKTKEMCVLCKWTLTLPPLLVTRELYLKFWYEDLSPIPRTGVTGEIKGTFMSS